MIKRESYGEVVWIKLLNFSKDQLESVRKNFQTVPEYHAFMDEPDEECDGAVCLIFEKHKPRSEKDIKVCKEMNKKHANQALKSIAELSRGLKLYFNPRTKNLRNLGY